MTVQNRNPEKLTQEQTDEAIKVIDAIGFISNDAPADIACPLNDLRTRLKRLINEIEGRNDDGWLIS
jgi:hypothetical protein